MSKEKHPLTRAHDLVELAYIYQEDGAFYTSAAKLREAAEAMEEHAKACDPTLEQPTDEDRYGALGQG